MKTGIVKASELGDDWTAERHLRLHPFEKAGLGKAPYKFIGMSENLFTIPGHVSKPGGSCKYCGTAIRYEYHVRSSDGNTFKVGSECIKKVEEKSSQLVKAVNEATKKYKKEKKEEQFRQARKLIAERCERAKEQLSNHPELFVSEPHPVISGRTLRDYYEFCLKVAGDKRKIEICELIDKEIA